VAEVGTHLLRSAVLAGVLNAVLDEKVNVVNAPAVAAARGLTVEEETGGANTVPKHSGSLRIAGKNRIGARFTAEARCFTTARHGCSRSKEFRWRRNWKAPFSI